MKVVVTGDSMLNCISEKGPSKSHKVTVKKFPGGTSNTIVENLDKLLKENLLRNNDLRNNVKLLNNVTKIVKQNYREAPSINLASLSIIVRKGKNKN